MPSIDMAGTYAATRERLLDLAATLDATQAAAAVPACPGWTVKDVYGHLVGGCSDIVAGNLEGGGSPAWTAKQVADRTGVALADVCDEWRRRGPELDALIRSVPDTAMRFVVFDVWTHEQDVLGALGRRGDRDGDAVRALAELALSLFAERLAKRDDGLAVRVVVDGDEHVLGSGEPAATLTTTPYELLRIVIGRRSADQIARAGWEGDPAAVVDALHLFTLPVVDLQD